MADAREPARLAIAWHPHHVEHLAPWCELLDMPLLLAESPALDVIPALDAIAADYPGVRIERMPGIVLPDRLDVLAHAIAARSPRTIFYSELFPRLLLRALFGGRRDTPRVVYVPHGFSEKRQDWAAATVLQDVAVLYGQAAVDQLAALGVSAYLGSHIRSGNLRRSYHARHAVFFRARAASLGLDTASAGRTLLYAPTWQDAIGSSSFFAAFAAFVDGLPAGWRLVVKLHPHLERDPGAVDALAARARGRDVHLLRAKGLCFPFLDLADAYVGDMSSLAYDYLAYGRPMFFTNPTAGTAVDAAESRLFGCGTVVPPDRYGDLYRLVDDAWDDDAERHGAARAALDAYVHEAGREPEAVATEMNALLAGPAPTWMSATP
jgi:hypothetical protein